MIYNSRFIFVHVPKTGGQSITSAFGGRSKTLRLHTPLRCVQKGDRFAFGFIRDPWQRMVSLYRFLCQKQFRSWTDNFDQELVRRIGFKKWLMADKFIMVEDTLPTGHPMRMREFWRGENGGELPPMQRRPQMWWLRGCDAIGRFEHMQEDVNLIAERIGRRPAPKVPHTNGTSGGPWQDEYDRESYEFVSEHFAEDIEFRREVLLCV